MAKGFAGDIVDTSSQEADGKTTSSVTMKMTEENERWQVLA
jgi:hypothetical protein